MDTENGQAVETAGEGTADEFLAGWEDGLAEEAAPAETKTPEEPAGEQPEAQGVAPAEGQPEGQPAGQAEGGETGEGAGKEAGPEQAVPAERGPRRAPARWGEEEERSGASSRREPGASGAQFLPTTWTLERDGQPFTVTEADMVALARKGLEYDKVRADYEESQPVMALFRDFAKKAGKPVPEYMAYLRTAAKQSDGMSEQEARRAVELEDREAAVAAREAEDQRRKDAAERETAARQSADARRQADIREFLEVFPEAAKDAAAIPAQVWEQVKAGRSLVSAYALYRMGQARQEAAAAAEREAAQRQNKANAAASAGSMRSAGSGEGSKDPFLQGWDE